MRISIGGSSEKLSKLTTQSSLFLIEQNLPGCFGEFRPTVANTSEPKVCLYFFHIDKHV